MVAVLAAKVGSKIAKTAAGNPGAGVLVGVLGVLVLANAFRSITEPIQGAVEEIVELPGTIWDAIKPSDPFPYEDFGDVGDDLFDLYGYDLRDAPGDVWRWLPFTDDDESDYIDYGSSEPLLLLRDSDPYSGFA